MLSKKIPWFVHGSYDLCWFIKKVSDVLADSIIEGEAEAFTKEQNLNDKKTIIILVKVNSKKAIQ